jgi:hypothetical protein
VNAAKHTPGPWAVSQNFELVFGRKQGPGLEPVGFVYGPSTPEDSEVGRRARADCHLIAAAPDLLACQTMGAQLNTPDFLDWIADRLEHIHGENPNVDYIRSLRDRADAGRAAIAKATGEQA